MPVRPAIAIIGRPNVGKSTLFNRLAGQRLAVVDAAPGTTRDRLVAPVTWEETLPFILVDTGGLTLEGDEHLGPQVRRQVGAALAEADLILFITDGSTGLHPGDAEVADLLRRQEKPVVLAVNKCESSARELGSAEFYQLGLGDPIPISAMSNIGIGEMLERLVSLLPPGEPEEEEAPVLKLALVGRPNVGKSSLLNAIVGTDRAIVDEVPGTTRDAVDISATYKDQPLVLIDTAGIRRRGHITPGLEQYSALRAFQAIQRSNVAILVLDATEMVTAQDTHVAGDVTAAYCGLVVAINKWDLARAHGANPAQALGLVRRRFKWAPYAPVRFTTAVTGDGVRALMDVALEVYQERQKHVGQGELNRLLMEAMATHPPSSQGSRRLRILKIVQSSTNPPTFTFYVNDPKLVHFSYERFLQNTLRSALGFQGSLLRFDFRKVARRWVGPPAAHSSAPPPPS